MRSHLFCDFRFLPLIFLPVCLSGQAGSITPPQDLRSVKSDYAAGQDAFTAQKWQLSAQLFARAAAAENLEAGPSHTDALWMEARSLVQLGEYTRAEGALRLSLRQEPRSAKVLYLLGLTLQRENQPKASLETFTVAASIAPPSTEDLRVVALDYVLLADYPDAIHWLERALKAGPENAETWYDLARAHMHDGKFSQAEEELKRSLALLPNNAKALDNLGICFEAQNLQEDAVSVYAKSISVAEATGQPAEQSLVDFGALLNTRNEFARAAGLLLRATELASGNSRAYGELARAYVGLQQLPKAQIAMERAVHLDPKNSRLHFQLGRIYRSAGLQDKAQNEFKLSSELYGQHATE